MVMAVQGALVLLEVTCRPVSLSSVAPTPTSHTSSPLCPPRGNGLREQRQRAQDAHCKVQSQESHPGPALGHLPGSKPPLFCHIP